MSFNSRLIPFVWMTRSTSPSRFDNPAIRNTITIKRRVVFSICTEPDFNILLN